MSWTENLLGQPGNFAPIIQTLTPADGVALEAIVQLLSEHAFVSGKTLQDYVLEGTGVNFSEYFADSETPITLANIATLRAVGVISCPDNTHVGLTTLGAGFLAAMNPG